MVTPFSQRLQEDADAPDYYVRPITLDDLDEVNRIDRDAFEAYRREHNQLQRPMRLRTQENMRAAIDRPHAGVVVEWPRGRIVGYCFTHVWGSLGWWGTLGVAPRNQGVGLGRIVIKAGLDVLREAGCQLLALETMPECGKNLALYTRLGLEARQLTMLLQGTPARASRMRFELWDGSDDSIVRISRLLIPGLDPTPAARWIAAEEAGETLIWMEDGEPAAFAVVRSAARRMDGPPAYLTIEVLGCLPRWAYHWPRYLSELQAYAVSQRRAGVVLPVNARQHNLLRGLLSAGMHIAYTRVRMVEGMPLGGPETLVMLTLAM